MEANLAKHYLPQKMGEEKKEGKCTGDKKAF